MKPAKRGRRPIGRKAMTAAERQARRRQRLREDANAVEQERLAREQPLASLYQPPPHGYPKAKAELLGRGHTFERARREFGFKEGVFVDGAWLDSRAVIAYAALSPAECEQRLAEARDHTKRDACDMVESYMGALHVSLDELLQHFRI
jgi:hypothetical protein